MATFNRDIPESFVDGAVPRQAVVGRLDEDTSVDEFLAAMADANIPEDQIHVLSGDEGAAVLNNMGTRLGRMFGPDREQPTQLLAAGATLVGVFGVTDDEQQLVSTTLNSAGVQVLHRFGKWTYT